MWFCQKPQKKKQTCGWILNGLKKCNPGLKKKKVYKVLMISAWGMCNKVKTKKKTVPFKRLRF